MQQVTSKEKNNGSVQFNEFDEIQGHRKTLLIGRFNQPSVPWPQVLVPSKLMRILRKYTCTA